MNFDELLLALNWIVTPALIVSIALGLLRFVDAGSRWERRLRGDLQTFGALPTGYEKDQMEKSVVLQARQLREYREAFGAWRQIVKWVQIAFIAVTVVMLLRYSPLNTPTTKIPLSPPEYFMSAIGGLFMVAAAIGLVRGRDWWNRTPRQLLRNDRLRRHNQRARRLRQIDKVRVERIAAGGAMRARGSRFGFGTQVDPLGLWMRTPELRQAARSRGTPALDIDYAARQAVHNSGQRLPPD